ncbi:MAG: TonB-dependent receptor [Flavobacteriales bacterium]|nr:MAG: TonB-dependent receptor [Flavobacteriales bacterium]
MKFNSKIFISLLVISSVSIYGQDDDEVKTKNIEEIIFQRRSKKKGLTSVKINTKDAQQVVSASGGIEGIIKTLPSVNSNTELSSQYMVRGGSYDENLIYINDLELYRPFLIRNSMQEGMSIINPDMVSTVNFSAGGFEAKYGDKMSSALNIYYREPKKFELGGEASLIGGRLTTGLATNDKKLTALVSGRYRNTNLILNTLKGDTDFNPQYMDFQSYLNYHVNKKLSFSFIGVYSKNDYEMIPKKKVVEFGTVQNPIKLNVYYGGRENDQYKNSLGNFSVRYRPSRKWDFNLNAFAYQNREREYYSIASGYVLQAFDPETGDPVTSYDVGGQIENARNDLWVKNYGVQLRNKYSPTRNSDIEFGFKLEKQSVKDLTNEWKLQDSLGYSVPRDYIENPANLDASDLELLYHIKGNNEITTNRYSGYVQYSQKMRLGNHKAFINAGARLSHWDYNKETIISPRLQLAMKPDWQSDVLFRLSGGVYYQAPFYKEIKNLDGSFNPNIKSQRSIQAILGADYEFSMSERPFKLTTEVYYKKMDHLIPYYLDNVRIRYTGKNNANGYAYGIDTRLYGEFVPGIDSWLSASYARVYENIDGKGNIPRPSDQRLRFSIFYQDYMPKFPKMRVNLTGVYAMGLPNGSPLFSDPYAFQKTLPSYKRVDIGLSYVFIESKKKNEYYGFLRNFDELSLGIQVFNAFNIYNTIANQWVTDVSTNYIYPVPVNLTGRFFNLKLNFKFK